MVAGIPKDEAGNQPVDWSVPLAERMRPQSLDAVVGQAHLLGEGQPLNRVLSGGALHSMVLWGPPGTGKTTLAKLLAHTASAQFFTLSAVTHGVKQVREIVEAASQVRAAGQQSVLFIDEIHRFNKAQQDAFLPHVENGTLNLIGATTENPAFELNNALLSRARVYVLKAIDAEDIAELLRRAMQSEQGLADLGCTLDDDALAHLAAVVDGDARLALGYLETAADLASGSDEKIIDVGLLEQVLTERIPRFDKGGDYFYDQISALHKSIRGDNPDAALYWVARMLDGGADPHYLLRRLVRIASEDIGNADPRALSLAQSAWEAWDRLGHPEGELAIAHAAAYLAVAPKSVAVYQAYKSAVKLARETPAAEVPVHLRNAPTKLAKELGHGKDYRYAPSEQGRYAAGQSYFPDEVPAQAFYQPVDAGLEIRIAEKLKELRARDTAAQTDSSSQSKRAKQAGGLT